MNKEHEQVLLNNLADDRAARGERAKRLDARPATKPGRQSSPAEKLVAKVSKHLGPLSTPDG